MRKTLQQTLFSTLKTIEGNGTFISTGINEFVFPGLSIDRVGDISFPIPAFQIKQMISVARKAPFGKGMETVTDTSVRSALEIDAKKLKFKNKEWKEFLQKLSVDIKKDLGIEDKKIALSLYKLLIYTKGDFFLPHKDSEKEKGMFGSLVVGLPSVHKGGELIVRFNNQEQIVDFSKATNDNKIPHAAFFADCEHEIKPILSGYRVCLVFNILQKGKEKISAPEFTPQVTLMKDQLAKLAVIPDNKPMVFLMEHQYTPTNFSVGQLKHHDHPRVKALLQAAENSGYFAKLGLVTCYLMGELEGVGYGYGGGGYGYSNQKDLTKGTMGEIYEREIVIDKWSEDGLPDFGEINIDEEDLIKIKSFELMGGEPIEKEAEGYTGNAGMTLEYWYHYGAVILWHKNHHVNILLDKPSSVRLNWLDFYLKNWDNKELASKSTVKLLLEGWVKEDWTEEDKSIPENMSAIAKALVKLDDKKFILKNGKRFLTAIFHKIHVTYWIELFQHYNSAIFTPTFNIAANTTSPKHYLHFLNILVGLDAKKNENFNPFIQQKINQIPNHLSKIKLHQLKENRYSDDKSRKICIYQIIENVLLLSKYTDDDEKWRKNIIQQLTSKMSRDFVNEIFVPILLSKNFQNKNLTKTLYQATTQDLIARTKQEPSPLKTWKRAVPNYKSYGEYWEILRPFLESPTEKVFDFARSQSYRSQMKSAIANVEIDLKTETIKKGSPHTLRITKTQSSYRKKLKHWEKDVSLLEKLNKLKE